MKRMLPLTAFPQLTQADCMALQTELAAQIQTSNSIHMDQIHTVAGVDLAYWNGKQEQAVCCIVVVEVQTGQPIEKTWSTGSITFPYLPGCLAFRELPLVVEAACTLKRAPDVYMFDGNGILHPRRMGLATHASFYLNAPTLGVAKSYYKLENAIYTPPENQKGSFSNIVVEGELRGRSIRTHQDVRPIFVSVGNDMDLDTATKIALRLTGTESHIPIPTRLADLETHIMRDSLRGSSV